MRKFLPGSSLLVFFFISHLRAEQLPDMRPALLGTGPNSLINLMNTQKLAKEGDAMVMFTCGVYSSGASHSMVTYRGTPNSKALAEEAIDKLGRAKFIPAVYNHKNTSAIVSGTIILGVTGGQPHLRIYLNQENEHLLRGDDFIAPQPIFVPGTKYKGVSYPKGVASYYSGTAVVTVDVDATGKLKGYHLTFESPPGKGFGNEVMSKIGDLPFLPGYLHGKPVACSATLQILFRAGGHGTHWKTE